MKTIIEQLVHEALRRNIPATIPREISIKRVSGKAAVLTGMRRTGKTSLCFQEISRLVESGVQRERILYLNFEDDRLATITIEDMQHILTAFYGANPFYKDQTCWFFFDEIQRVVQWELFIRRILDNEDVEVTLTGSSAKLLSREIGTAMRGRAILTEVFPLSFREFCRFHALQLSQSSVYSARERLELAKMATDYLETGGFPEVQRCDKEIWRTILQDYADVVILRDVIERHGVTNYVATKALVRHILQNSGQLLSVTKLATSFSQAGISCSKNLLFDLIEHLHDAYFCYPIEIHDRSLRRRQVNPRKVYTIDTGLTRAFSVGMTHDRGSTLESAVFTTLRTVGKQVDYVITDQKRGVDFVYRDDSGWHFIQVAWTMADKETKEREFRALADAKRLHPQARRSVITWNEEGEEDGVLIKPVWRWWLEGVT